MCPRSTISGQHVAVQAVGESSTVFLIDHGERDEATILLGPKIYYPGSYERATTSGISYVSNSSDPFYSVTRVDIPVLIRKIFSGRNHCHIVTTSGKVLSFGLNAKGSLCCGFEGVIRLCDQPSGCTNLPRGLIGAVGPINDHDVIDGAAGGCHSVFITKNKVFVCGGNKVHQCGLELGIISTPTELEQSLFGGSIVVGASCGDTHTVFITSKSELFVCGSNTNGCCSNVKSYGLPTRVSHFPSCEIPIKVSCGYDNTAVLCKSGKAYGWGCNSCGQIPHPGIPKENSPTIRQAFFREDLVDVMCGYFCSVAKSSSDGWLSFPDSNGFTVLSQNLPKARCDSIIQCVAGDCVLFVTNEAQDNGDFGRIFKRRLGVFEEISGDFFLHSPMQKVAISNLRDGFLFYTVQTDDISRNFIFLRKILESQFEAGKNIFHDVSVHTF